MAARAFTFGKTLQARGNPNQQLLSSILGKIETEDRAKLDDAAKKIAEYMDDALNGCSKMKGKLKSCAEKVSLLDEFGAQTYELVETQLQLLASYNLFFDTLKGVLQKYNFQELLNTDTQLNQLKYLTADAINKFVDKVDVMQDIYKKHGLTQQSSDLKTLHETLKKFGSIDKQALLQKQQQDKKYFDDNYKNKDVLPEIKLDPTSPEGKEEQERQMKIIDETTIYFNSDKTSGQKVLNFANQAQNAQRNAFDDGNKIAQVAKDNFNDAIMEPKNLVSETEIVEGSKPLVPQNAKSEMSKIINNSKKFQAPAPIQQKKNNATTPSNASRQVSQVQKKQFYNAISKQDLKSPNDLKKLLNQFSNNPQQQAQVLGKAQQLVKQNPRSKQNAPKYNANANTNNNASYKTKN